MAKKNFNKINKFGFTIVELLVVIVVIGILSTLAFVSYQGVAKKAIVASVQSDLENISKQIRLFEVDNGQFPGSINDCPNPSNGNLCLKLSNGNSINSNSINNTSKTFCVSVANGDIVYFVDNGGILAEGSCVDANVSVLAVGGGGSGAASANGGTGGSGGNVVSSSINIKSKIAAVTVGNGGAGVAPDNNGNAGGLSSFSTITANGGNGGAAGSSNTNALSGIASSISGSSLYYGGGGGSSNSMYTKTAGGIGGGGGGIPSSAYGDGSRNLVSNGYAGLLYRLNGLLSYTATYVVNAGNFFGTMGDISTRVSGPTTQHLPKNNSGAILSSATSTSNTYTFSPTILPNRQVEIEMHGGNMTSGIAITGIYLNFNGTLKSLSQAVADGYIEPMVIMNSGVSTGSYYWSNIFNVYTNTSTGNGNYPSGGVLITLKEYSLTGFTLNLSRGFHATDGIMVTSWDRLGGISLAPIPSINGQNGLGGGGGANTAANSGDGGSGVVVVSYPTGSISATGGTITTSGGNTIHTFTSSGTFTIN